MNALIYALGIYGLSLLVTLLVWLVIVAIRWLSGERAHPKPSATKPQ